MCCCVLCFMYAILFTGSLKTEEGNSDTDSVVRLPEDMLAAASSSDSSFKFNLDDDDLEANTVHEEANVWDAVRIEANQRHSDSQETDDSDAISQEENDRETASQETNDLDMIIEEASGRDSVSQENDPGFANDSSDSYETEHDATVYQPPASSAMAKRANLKKRNVKKTKARKSTILKRRAKRTVRAPSAAILRSSTSNQNIPRKQKNAVNLSGSENSPTKTLKKCPKCGQLVYNVKRHLLLKHGQKPPSSEQVLSQQYPEEPDKTSHLCKKVSCHLCLELFKQADLKLHLLTHYGLPCAVCFKVFPEKKLLDDHRCVRTKASA
ncbi:uncharacterized protein LOC117648039 [Thrips palmi]|uniref:Uncharacterized protein LOC117648039 n=1 Tax=Thrips palmi TaxID=161013 RepID=A0A6P8Z0T3_THRPL|nr:uncharacterized protein LOC117648039 [Thrips palmi]XP_034246079.1 uncharacterized protein LOC117648039 [Thrips palmi]XP_034246080.1 uncharacterized protein LOC117648039 [Thrips palmi]XP_034246082.1 uncharacterized protein LOC117648039 [Thrips palmi]XP_034246083.1 uncharacterized protein LOC117648039 [Thrips palmi]XP_034246084.1 uncharacterized protein LOC117648039 [Thrips palmi]